MARDKKRVNNSYETFRSNLNDDGKEELDYLRQKAIEITAGHMIPTPWDGIFLESRTGKLIVSKD